MDKQEILLENGCLLLRKQDNPNTLWESYGDINFNWVEDTSETLLGFRFNPEEKQGNLFSDFLVKKNDVFHLYFNWGYSL